MRLSHLHANFVMNDLLQQGLELRSKAKELAISVLNKHPDGNKNGTGVKQAEVFRLCGLGWGDYSKAPGSSIGQSLFRESSRRRA